jgi:hypothetical protein
MRGDATLFTRRDEVEAEWRVITPIEEAWAKLPMPEFPDYAAGSEGPTSWHELLKISGNLVLDSHSRNGRSATASSVPVMLRNMMFPVIKRHSFRQFKSTLTAAQLRHSRPIVFLECRAGNDEVKNFAGMNHMLRNLRLIESSFGT